MIVVATSSALPRILIHFRRYLANTPVKILDNQPVAAPSSSIKKCCPLHQHYKYDYGRRSCANSTERFAVNAIQARFYENCIEDEEMNVTISVVVENNCKK